MLIVVWAQKTINPDTFFFSPLSRQNGAEQMNGASRFPSADLSHTKHMTRDAKPTCVAGRPSSPACEMVPIYIFAWWRNQTWCILSASRDWPLKVFLYLSSILLWLQQHGQHHPILNTSPLQHPHSISTASRPTAKCLSPDFWCPGGVWSRYRQTYSPHVPDNVWPCWQPMGLLHLGVWHSTDTVTLTKGKLTRQYQSCLVPILQCPLRNQYHLLWFMCNIW